MALIIVQFDYLITSVHFYATTLIQKYRPQHFSPWFRGLDLGLDLETTGLIPITGSTSLHGLIALFDVRIETRNPKVI